MNKLRADEGFVALLEAWWQCRTAGESSVHDYGRRLDEVRGRFPAVFEGPTYYRFVSMSDRQRSLCLGRKPPGESWPF